MRRLANTLGRNTDELDPIECNVLRLCTYELASRIDIPYRVTINEAIEPNQAVWL